MTDRLNQIKSDLIRLILSLIIKNSNLNLSNYHLIQLNKFLLDSKTDNRQKFIIFDIFKDLNLSLTDLYNEYLNLLSVNQIKSDIKDSQSFYNKLDLNQFYIDCQIDRLTNNLLILIDSQKYLSHNLNDIKSVIITDLKDCLTDFYNLSQTDSLTDSLSDLHKFIKIYDINQILDLIYCPFYLKKVIIDSNCQYKDIKSFITNKNNLICFKIDNDLLQSNKYKLNQIDYLQIKITYYDSQTVYYICNKLDLLSIDINYSYDFNNYISYVLDSFKSYYTVFNDNKIKSNVFKTFNFKGFNMIVSQKIKDKNYDIMSDFKYKKSLKSFKDLFDLDLYLKSVNKDLDKVFVQLDLDLISIDNNIDYNKVLDKYYNIINDLIYDLDLKLNDCQSLNYDLLDNLIDLSIYYDYNYLDYDFDFLIDFISHYNYNTDLLNQIKTNECLIKDLKKDIQTLNECLNIFEDLYKDLDKSNTLYEYKNNCIDFDNMTLKNHNTIFNTSKYDFDKVCYLNSNNNTDFYQIKD